MALPASAQKGPGQASLEPLRPRRRIILCFDGTGNKFSGTDADSNILKIYRMLDRNNGDKHYYQPGIGTYVKGSLSHTSVVSRVNSWYQKAKDSAVGTSFDDHVMGAYKFLMSAYEDDDIYFFGFSRGAYVARFLAEMLDHVGLLSKGNEEMARFAWKAFAQWQQRDESTEEEKKKKEEMLKYLQAFRDTFSRPVRRIRFLGLFDTVNSVPRFENAWMQRSKFPYTARSSAKVIRHAVSIDERRAKFRQDLVSGKAKPKPHQHRHLFLPAHHQHPKAGPEKSNPEKAPEQRRPVDRFRRASSYNANQRRARSQQRPGRTDEGHLGSTGGLSVRPRTPSPGAVEAGETASVQSGASSYLPTQIPTDEQWEEDEAAPQDIEELWFPGCHADLGGGWHLWPGEETSLSHGPLVWMVREAQRAGLEFEGDKMITLKCCEDYAELTTSPPVNGVPGVPTLEITGSPSDPASPAPLPPMEGGGEPDIFHTPRQENPPTAGWAPGLAPTAPSKSAYQTAIENSYRNGVSHDCLQFHNGLPAFSVLSWKIMEYLPFRRMDLRPDGTWKAISLPLPMGETRDIPEDAQIHCSAIERMKAKPDYRPGNLIVGGGGRGMRTAPKEMGIGEWKVLKGEGDPVGCVYVRAKESMMEKLELGKDLPKGVEEAIEKERKKNYLG